MKRIISIMFLAAAIDPAFAAQTMAQALAEAKAACPNCYRVVCTNGVYVGMNRADYDAYMAAKAARPLTRKRMFGPRKTKPKERPKGRGPIPLRRGWQKPVHKEGD